MHRLAVLVLLLVVLTDTALAAPPLNDNRSAAEPIPTFPHTVAASTV